MRARELYDEDFFEWTRCNAALLRAGRLEEVDIAHVAEEIEDMGKRDQRELGSRLRVLLIHLLKWRAQPGRRSASWRATIRTQRAEIRKLIEQAPSLRRALASELAEIHDLAGEKAAAETGLSEDQFPKTCPFSLDEILDEQFLPE